MKCKECRSILKNFYVKVGLLELCSHCASKLIEDISDFKVSLGTGAGK